jgi:endogenous inhibitor of DNA gyrase (YacG/DUF329 family)
MAKRQVTCLICGKAFTDYDAAPRLFCSVGCEADVGEPLADLYARQAERHDQPARARPASTARSARPGVPVAAPEGSS